MPKWLIWVLSISGVILLLGGGFAFGKYYQEKKSDQKKTANANVNANANANVNSNANANTNKSNANANTNSAGNYSGWKTYTNAKYNYTIKYPSDGKTETVDTGVANDGLCVKVSTDYIYAIIDTGTTDDKTMCLRTGVGSEWTNTTPLKIVVLGKEYIFSGMLTEAASAGTHEEFYSSSFDSGEGVNIGVSVNEKYDTKGTKFADKKAEMIKMIQSFAHIN